MRRAYVYLPWLALVVVLVPLWLWLADGFAALHARPRFGHMTSAGLDIAGLDHPMPPTVSVGQLSFAVKGGKPVFVSGDGRYVFEGQLYDMSSNSNLSENGMRNYRMAKLKTFAHANDLVYRAKHGHYVVTVFSDVECGFCKVMHSRLAEYAERGITIRYILYPRSGIDSSAYYREQAVWCASDRRTAMDHAMAGNFAVTDVLQAACDSPIAEGYRLGKDLGVMGTPTIVLPDGKLHAGYLAPADLLKLLVGGNVAD